MFALDDSILTDNVAASNIYATNTITLSDTNKRGKERKWRTLKKLNILLANSYQRLARKEKSFVYASRKTKVYQCGATLVFNRLHDGSLRLHQAFFCKDKLCPLCSWRRSRLVFGQVNKIMNEVEFDKYDFQFLTLTIKNPELLELKAGTDLLLAGWNRLTQRKFFKDNTVGYFRSLEIKKAKNKSDWHPHIHALIIVPKGSVKLIDRRNKPKLISEWQKAIRSDYAPSVDCRAAYDQKGIGIAATVAEAAKYSVKTDTIIIDGEDWQTDQNVSVIAPALYKRRLISYGGLLADIKKRLKLEDDEEHDLIKVDNDEEDDVLHPAVAREVYTWHFGFGDYIQTDILPPF